jgi:hypothetical protein
MCGSFRSRKNHSTAPDFLNTAFESVELPDYNESSFGCPVPSDKSPAEYPEDMAQREGQFDSDDTDFYDEQKSQGFPLRAYSADHFQHTASNPRKWFEIGVAYSQQGHASVIIHDISGVASDREGREFQNVNGPKAKDKRFTEGRIRRLHLFLDREDNLRTLSFDDITLPTTFARYHPVYRIGTTDRMIKYIAAVSFPTRYYRLSSDCATFAHAFLCKLLERSLDTEGGVTEPQYKMIKKYLVKNNHTQTGATGDTEASSRRHQVAAESGGATLETVAK